MGSLSIWKNFVNSTAERMSTFGRFSVNKDEIFKSLYFLCFVIDLRSTTNSLDIYFLFNFHTYTSYSSLSKVRNLDLKLQKIKFQVRFYSARWKNILNVNIFAKAESGRKSTGTLNCSLFILENFCFWLHASILCCYVIFMVCDYGKLGQYRS